MPTTLKIDNRKKKNLYKLLTYATELVDEFSENMSTDQYQWQRNILGHNVMLASVLVVIGLWWMVRAVLSLLINLVCPLVVVFLAVMCVPQLRSPLLGQNYPAVANILKSILLKMAENIKTQ